MFDPYRSKPSRRGSTNLASCIVATVFLVFVGAIIVTVYFLVFKPKSPRIAVDAVQFPTFSISNATVNFTFFQYVTVTNPNRDQFTHYDSSLQLSYSGQPPIGVVLIPAGKIDAGRTQHMSANFNVQSYPLPSALKAVSSSSQLSGAGGGGGVGMGMGPTMVIETRMKLVGRVRVLKVLTHRVVSKVRCGVVIQVSTGSVLAIHC